MNTQVGLKRSFVVLVALALLPACDDAVPIVAQPDAAPPTPDAPAIVVRQLDSIEPRIAHAGDRVFLDGKFPEATTVMFPGGVSAAATLLGSQRAVVTVPAGARSGALSVVIGSQTFGPLGFRVATFPLGLSPFRAYDGAEIARTPPTLSTARSLHTSARLGRYLYLFGGTVGGIPSATIDRALVGADGSLVFAPATALLATARMSPTTHTIGDAVYVIGGSNGSVPLASVERAPVDLDGVVGTFEPIAATLGTARSGHASVVIGAYLYVLGGTGPAGVTATVERAPIGADGMLGAFEPATAMATARSGHAIAKVGTTLYVLGGTSGQAALDSIESALISPDGTLGAFSVLARQLTSPRHEHTVTVLGDHVLVIGGRSDAGALATTEIATIDLADDTLGPLLDASSIATLAKTRAAHTAMLIGNDLVVLGGENVDGAHRTLERATVVNATTLDAFVNSAATLAMPPARHTAVVVGNGLYLIGGNRATQVQRAPIDDDGMLGPFDAADLALVVPRVEHASAMIGGYVYIFGGAKADYSANPSSVERSEVRSDGTLGPFATVDGVTLVTPRRGLAATIIGDYVYLLGGQGAPGWVTTVERAPINGDGTIGSFADVAGVSIPAGVDRPCVVVLGHNLYVLGNLYDLVTGIQRSTIASDFSSIGPFAGDSTLPSHRARAMSVVIGGFLYLIGGSNVDDSSGFAFVERAPIDAAGVLGSFEPHGTLVNARTTGTVNVIGNRLYVVGGEGTLPIEETVFR